MGLSFDSRPQPFFFFLGRADLSAVSSWAWAFLWRRTGDACPGAVRIFPSFTLAEAIRFGPPDGWMDGWHGHGHGHGHRWCRGFWTNGDLLSTVFGAPAPGLERMHNAWIYPPHLPTHPLRGRTTSGAGASALWCGEGGGDNHISYHISDDDDAPSGAESAGFIAAGAAFLLDVRVYFLLLDVGFIFCASFIPTYDLPVLACFLHTIRDTSSYIQ